MDNKTNITTLYTTDLAPMVLKCKFVSLTMQYHECKSIRPTHNDFKMISSTIRS